MPTKTSNNLGNAFATTAKAHSAPLRFTVTATNSSGSFEHTFVDLDCAVGKIRQMAALGFFNLSLKTFRCDTASD